MSTPQRLTAGIAGLAVVLIAGCTGSGQGAATGSPAVATATAAPASAVAPAASPSGTPVDVTTWVSFTSAFYGFTASHPAGWTERRATVHWNLVRDQTDSVAAEDGFTSADGLTVINAFGILTPSGITSDSFIDAYIAPNIIPACIPTTDKWLPTTIDGHPARLWYGGCDVDHPFGEAVTVIADRIWFFDFFPTSSLITPFLSTVHFHPEAVVDEVAPSPSAP